MTNLRNPAYHESHQTLSTWVMLPTYHRSSFAAGQTVYFILQMAILLSNRLAYCMFGSSHYCTLLFPPHAGVYVVIPSTCRCIRRYSLHMQVYTLLFPGAPDTKEGTSRLSCDEDRNCAYTFSCIHVGTRHYFGIVMISPSVICGHFEHCNNCIPDFLTVAIVLAGCHCCLTGSWGLFQVLSESLIPNMDVGSTFEVCNTVNWSF